MFWKKKRTPNYELTDDDREAGKEVTRKKRELKVIREQIKLEQAKAELELQREELAMARDERRARMAELYGSDGDDDDDYLKMLMPMLLGGQNNGTISPQQPNNVVQSSEEISPLLSDSEIDVLLANTPKHLVKKAKKLSDVELGSQISAYSKLQGQPLSNDNIDKIIKRFRETFK